MPNKFRLTLYIILIASFLAAATNTLHAANNWLDDYNVTWNSPSKNAGESMPCGGGDIGLNVWVENGDVLMYMARSGTFNELSGFPKLGRLRLRLDPNPFKNSTEFKQTLNLKEGAVEIMGDRYGMKAVVTVWVDVFRPVIHLDVAGNQKMTASLTYENWRLTDQVMGKGEKEAMRSWLGAPVEPKLRKDEVTFVANNSAILFFHQNRNTDGCFDLLVQQQGLESVKDQLDNPLKNRIFGGIVKGRNFVADSTETGRYASTPYKGWRLKSQLPATRHKLEIVLHTAQAERLDVWEAGLATAITEAAQNNKKARKATQGWWEAYWDRSYIRINERDPASTSQPWQVGRNYQVFRYQLGCNAFGEYPTKFNGGLFTFDPEYVDPKRTYSPDYRAWGGGSFTAQNQRLVYWPLLKSGDVDLMKPQFDFYNRLLHNAELRTQVYWGHQGASFTEQLELLGLPVGYEYGWKRPAFYDKGMQYNKWVDYQWDTVLEFCFMMLEAHRYAGMDIKPYLPLMESALRFYDEHYQYLAERRSPATLDANGHLVLYPGTACETYKMATNATSTICALQSVLNELLALDSTFFSPDTRSYLEGLLTRIPPISFREMNGHKVIAPAKSFERINNTEIPQLYPVFPYGWYGVGKPDLQVAIDTWQYGIENPEQKHYQSWHQDNIFCARLGLTDEAKALTLKKLGDAPRRFPTWWGPGNDWVPDHNWGGSGMIGLQEMLLQTNGDSLLLFPAWPKEWDVTFKLHAPKNTTIEATLKNGQLKELTVEPAERKKDVVILLQ